jgi:hypothetical protein
VAAKPDMTTGALIFDNLPSLSMRLRYLLLVRKCRLAGETYDWREGGKKQLAQNVYFLCAMLSPSGTSEGF